jgi:signal transduction histidine kinase
VTSAVRNLQSEEELLTPVRNQHYSISRKRGNSKRVERLAAVLRKEDVDSVDVTRGTPLVLADKRALINAVNNLVGNAADAMPKKDRTIVIHAYKEPMSEMTRIDIEDWSNPICNPRRNMATTF